MKYTIALEEAVKAATYLQENEGRISFAEAAVHVFDLDHALKAIAKRYGVELPPRPKP
jgi:hypothetical protein